MVYHYTSYYDLLIAIVGNVQGDGVRLEGFMLHASNFMLILLYITGVYVHYVTNLLNLTY